MTLSHYHLSLCTAIDLLINYLFIFISLVAAASSVQLDVREVLKCMDDLHDAARQSLVPKHVPIKPGDIFVLSAWLVLNLFQLTNSTSLTALGTVGHPIGTVSAQGLGATTAIDARLFDEAVHTIYIRALRTKHDSITLSLSTAG